MKTAFVTGGSGFVGGRLTPTTPLPSRAAARLEESRCRISFVGHGEFPRPGRQPQYPPRPPVWSERASALAFAGPARHTPPGVAFNDLPPIDAVLVSHNHYDHMDLGTLARLWRLG